MRLFTLLCVLVSGLAFAGSKQVSLPIGHSTTLSMPSTVTKVTLSEPGRVDVKRDGKKVTFVAKSKGTTEVVVTTSEGEHRIKIYVAEDKYGMPY